MNSKVFWLDIYTQKLGLSVPVQVRTPKGPPLYIAIVT